MPKYTPETLAAWLAALPNPENEERDLKWFFAYRQAEQYADFSMKELARELYAGIPEISIENELEAIYDLEPLTEDDIHEANEDLEEEIKIFFEAGPSEPIDHLLSDIYGGSEG